MRIRKRISIPLLASFLVLAYSLLQPRGLIQAPPGPSLDEERIPESYAREVVVRDYSESGSLLDETSATELRRYTSGPRDFTELDNPRRSGHEGDFAWPVVSVSLGDEALFRMGNTTRGGKTESLWLRSGDVVVMGGDARLAFHGIDRVKYGSSMLLRDGGRINLTLRVVEPAPS